MLAASQGRRAAVLVGFVLAAACARLLPHPPNFTPIGALALFGGATFASRRGAYLVPLLALLASDLVLELASGTGFHAAMPLVYGCFAATVWLGRRLRGRIATVPVVTSSLVAALGFFALTNFAVWAGGGTYPPTAGGLLACYLAALPFFGNTLAGFAVYGGLLFGAWALLERRFPTLARART